MKSVQLARTLEAALWQRKGITGCDQTAATGAIQWWLKMECSQKELLGVCTYSAHLITLEQEATVHMAASHFCGMACSRTSPLAILMAKGVVPYCFIGERPRRRYVFFRLVFSLFGLVREWLPAICSICLFGWASLELGAAPGPVLIACLIRPTH